MACEQYDYPHSPTYCGDCYESRTQSRTADALEKTAHYLEVLAERANDFDPPPDFQKEFHRWNHDVNIERPSDPETEPRKRSRPWKMDSK